VRGDALRGLESGTWGGNWCGSWDQRYRDNGAMTLTPSTQIRATPPSPPRPRARWLRSPHRRSPAPQPGPPPSPSATLPFPSGLEWFVVLDAVAIGQRAADSTGGGVGPDAEVDGVGTVPDEGDGGVEGVATIGGRVLREALQPRRPVPLRLAKLAVDGERGVEARDEDGGVAVPAAENKRRIAPPRDAICIGGLGTRGPIGDSLGVAGVSAPVRCLARTGERASARPQPRRCATRAVRPAVRTGDPGPAEAGGGPCDEGALRPEAAVGHEEMQMRMPVGAGAMRLQTRHDAHREVALAGQRANGGRDGAGGDTRDLAEQAAPVETGGAQPLRDGEHHLPVRHRREQRGVQPLGPDGEALGVAAGAEMDRGRIAAPFLPGGQCAALSVRSGANSIAPVTGTLRSSRQGGVVPVGQVRGANGRHRERRSARVSGTGAGPLSRQGPRHHAMLRLVCQPPAWHAAEGGACRRGRSAGDHSRPAAGADRGHPPLFESLLAPLHPQIFEVAPPEVERSTVPVPGESTNAARALPSLQPPQLALASYSSPCTLLNIAARSITSGSTPSRGVHTSDSTNTSGSSSDGRQRSTQRVSGSTIQYSSTASLW